MSLNRARPAEVLRGERSESHLGILAQGLPQWSLSHVWPDLEEQTPPALDCPVGKRGVPISAQEDGMQAVPLVELADQNESCVSAKGENVSKMSYKSVYTKEKGNSIRLQSLVGNVFLKGACVPWKQSPEAQFQLISAKLATANELRGCQ